MKQYEELEELTSKLLVCVVQMRVKGYDVKDFSILDGEDIVTVQFTTVFRTGRPAIHYVVHYDKKSDTYVFHHTIDKSIPAQP